MRKKNDWLNFSHAWLQNGWLDLRFQYGKEGKVYQLQGTVNGQSKRKQVSGKHERQSKVCPSLVSTRSKAKSVGVWWHLSVHGKYEKQSLSTSSDYQKQSKVCQCLVNLSVHGKYEKQCIKACRLLTDGFCTLETYLLLNLWAKRKCQCTDQQQAGCW